MKVAVDTNVLVRALVQDDARQARAAAKLLREAEVVAVSSASLCELVWVLGRVYRLSSADIARAIEALIDARNVAVDGPAVEAGLAILEEGGDFADGLIAFEGRRLGGETFVSFDKIAVAMLVAQGLEARAPAWRPPLET